MIVLLTQDDHFHYAKPDYGLIYLCCRFPFD